MQGLISVIFNLAVDLSYDTESITTKEKTDTLKFIKMEKSCVSRDTIKKVKRHPQSGWKYLQIVHLLRDSRPECMKDSDNSKGKG